MNKKIKYALIPGVLGLSLLINPNKPLVNKVEAKENDTKNNSTDKILNVSKIIELQNKNLNKVESNVEREEKIVTDKTKTPDESDKVADIDKTVIDGDGEFVGKENRQTSLSGNKDIAKKEDLNRAITVDEFNKQSNANAKAKLEAEILNNEKKIKENKNKIKELEKLSNDYIDNRTKIIADEFKDTFNDDFSALMGSQYEWAFAISNSYIYYEFTGLNKKEVYYQIGKLGPIRDYDESKYHFSNKTFSYIDGNNIKEVIGPSIEHDIFRQKSINIGINYITERLEQSYDPEKDDVFDTFEQTKSAEYIDNNKLIERMNDKFEEIKNKYYYDDKEKLDSWYSQAKILNEENEKLRSKNADLKYRVQYENNTYARITQETIIPKTVEIVKDDSIWSGNFRWERYSKDGYIKTLYQNDKEIAKRIQHPLVGIKRVGTKTEEVRERREVESTTYDVIERPTDNKEENGKVIQEGSDGLVEKIYDATYDKYSNVIKKELKETIVKKEQKDRIILRYGIKEETKTPVTLYDGIKNYNTDEKKIKNYSEKERYRTTDLQQGNVNQDFLKSDEKKEKDGFKFELNNPSATSSSEIEYGYQITIDKAKGQRTYTNIYVTDSGRIPVGAGDKSMMDDGEKLTSESPDVTYKPTENSIMDAYGTQRNLNFVASEETLKHINSKDNSFTSFGMKDNYTKENPEVKFFGPNFALGYKVNPWPNENDKLEELKLIGTYDKKEYVKGQEIKTDIRINNLDENSKERLVGQVYNPTTGEVVKEANAYVGDDGYVYIKMPEGVINEDGTENKDSIFNTPDYKGLQNLDVKFFARPRTKDEFTKIADTPDEFGDTGVYTETGAGSKFINHKGREIEADLQGIDRYDHYNLIGSFKLQLDDTRYYDQNFLGSDNKDTTKHTSIPILPGQDFTAKVYLPEDKKDNPYQKSDLDIKDDESKANLIGKLDKKYIENYNKDRRETDRWAIKDDDITKFTITAPKTAKSGDFMAVPIEYTYTNGSKDTHWFHFVVQGSENNVPSYQIKVGNQGDTLVSDKYIEEDENKNDPLSYELADDEYIDSEGNRWTNVTIDPKTGQVKATVPKDVKINGGEILTVNVKVNYKDKFGIEKQEIVKAEFVARPKYDGKFTYTEKQEIPFNTEIQFDDSLKAGEQKVTQEGEAGEKEREISQTYENDKMSDQVIGGFKITKEPKNRIITVGSKTEGVHEYKEKIPFKYTVKEDPNLKKGEWVEDVKGIPGEKTTKWTIVNSEIVGEPFIEETKPVDAVIRVGTGSLNGNLTIEETNIIQYETKVEIDDTIESGKIQITGGEVGEKKRNVELTIVDGEVTNKEEGEFKQTKAPVDKVIKVGSKTNGTHSYVEDVPFKTKVEKNPELKKGEWRYKIVNGKEQTGELGKKKISWKIENSKIVGKPETEIVKNPVDAIIEIGDEDFTGTVTHQVKEEKAFDVEIVENPNMTAGTSNIKQKGVKGEVVTEYSQKIKNGEADGEMISKEISNKPAVKQIIEVGTKPANNNKDITNETNVKIEYVYDENLDKGIVKTGDLVKGKVTTKIVNEYNPKTGQIETVEKTTVEDAVQKIIVGTKDFTGKYEYEHTEKIPFEVEVRKDPTLKKGESKVLQKGEAGEKYYKYSQNIKNGKPDGERKTVEEKTTKKAVKEIILVGTGAIEGETTKVVKRKIPFETKIIYDENLETGKAVVENEGKPGEEEVTITTKSVDGKMTQTEDVKTISKKEDRVVRIGIKPIEREIETGFNTIYKHNKDLKDGEFNTITEGVNGKVVTKIFFNKETGKIETKEEKIDPIDKVVEYGSKTEGKVKVESDIPFEIEVIKDDTLKAGEVKVDQEGELGKKETIITIENSKEVDREENVVKEPIKKIIRVGTKCDDCCKPEPDNKDEQPKPNKPEPDDKDKKPNPDDDKKKPCPDDDEDKPEPDGEEELDPDGDKDKPNPDGDKDKQNPNGDEDKPEPDNKDKKPEPDKEKPDNKDKSKSSEKDSLDKKPVDEKNKPVNNTSNETPTKKEATNSQTVENKKNVRTGVSGVDGAIVSALLASVGLTVTGRKKKED